MFFGDFVFPPLPVSFSEMPSWTPTNLHRPTFSWTDAIPSNIQIGYPSWPARPGVTITPFFLKFPALTLHEQDPPGSLVLLFAGILQLHGHVVTCN